MLQVIIRDQEMIETFNAGNPLLSKFLLRTRLKLLSRIHMLIISKIKNKKKIGNKKEASKVKSYNLISPTLLQLITQNQIELSLEVIQFEMNILTFGPTSLILLRDTFSSLIKLR